MKVNNYYCWLVAALFGFMLIAPDTYAQVSLKRYVQAGGGVFRASSGGVFHSGTFGETIVGRFIQGTHGFWSSLLLPTPVHEESIPQHQSTLTATPNPVSSSTTITFSIPSVSRVSVRITDALGRVVRTIAEEQYNAGTFQLPWDGKSDSGTRASAGSYQCQLSIQPFSGGAASISRLMIVLTR